MVVGTGEDLARAYRLFLAIDGTTMGSFQECSGLNFSTDPIEYREGTVSLKRGVTDSTFLWDWYDRAINGEVDCRNGSIFLLDETGAERVRWDFREGWPTKLVGPSFSGTGNEVAIETLEITHEGLKLA